MPSLGAALQPQDAPASDRSLYRRPSPSLSSRRTGPPSPWGTWTTPAIACGAERHESLAGSGSSPVSIAGVEEELIPAPGDSTFGALPLTLWQLQASLQRVRGRLPIKEPRVFGHAAKRNVQNSSGPGCPERTRYKNGLQAAPIEQRFLLPIDLDARPGSL